MTSDSPRWFLGIVSILPDWGTEFMREQIVNHLEDRRHQLAKAIIRCGTGESAQQCDVVTPRTQARTKGDEGHRVRLGTTHGSQQDVVSQRGLDQRGDAQEEDEPCHLCGCREGFFGRDSSRSYRDEDVDIARDTFSTRKADRLAILHRGHIHVMLERASFSSRTLLCIDEARNRCAKDLYSFYGPFPVD